MVESHYSCNSSERSGELFSSMFPDSALARNFASGATKSRYMITFGLAPYFLDALKDKVKLSSDYVLLFDESLNKKK